MLNTYYDSFHDRLVQVGVASTAAFWDAHWQKPLKAGTVSSRSFILPIVKKFLRKGRLLEAGCGKGDKVYLLKKQGFDVIGVDYAQETVDKVKKTFPDLDIRCADVRHLPFENNVFDGYISIGVIEHFYEGYEEIMHEVYRVLRVGGYAFIAFPYISCLRRMKINKHAYPFWVERLKQQNEFYQFIYPVTSVIKSFEKKGFSTRYTFFHDGTKGVKDEVPRLKRPLQMVYDSSNISAKVVKYSFDRLFSWLAGHLCLVVFRKE